MKRADIIEKLLSEGFTERTLSRLGDKQLQTLARKIMSEATIEVSADKLDMVKAKAKPEDVIRVSEEDEINEEDGEEKSDEMETWVLNLAENKFSSFTSKKDIIGIITEKVKEASIPMPATKATKGHNGVPEFMTFDAITGNQPSPNPTQPEVIPDAPPTEKPSKPKTPYKPGPGTNPKPKALAEKE